MFLWGRKATLDIGGGNSNHTEENKGDDSGSLQARKLLIVIELKRGHLITLPPAKKSQGQD